MQLDIFYYSLTRHFQNLNIVIERYLVCRNNFIKNDDDCCIGDSFRIITRTVLGLLQEWIWDYYGNGFKIIMGTVLRLLRERF